MKRRQVLGTLALGAASSVQVARAQLIGSSDRTLRIISGFPAGSSLDSVARIIAPAMEKILNANIIVEYKTGAGGRIGNTYVKNAKPDGRTLLLCSSSLMAIYPHVFKKMPYDATRDFVPVTAIVNFEYAPVVSTQAVPASVKTLRDYIQWVKSDPANSNYGSPASGSMPHLIGSILSQSTGVKLNHVSFNGGAPHLQALSGGQMPFGIDALAGIVPHLQAGRIRLLATGGADRMVPGVPTVAEAGFPELTAEDYFGLFYPAGTPAEQVNQIQSAVQTALRQDKVQESYRQLTFKPNGAAPAEFTQRVNSEYERWRKVVVASGFTIDE